METKQGHEGELYMTVSSPFVVNLAREIYWFEGNQEKGLEILKCFIGISDQQITSILNGDATVIDAPRPTYKEGTDIGFKAKLHVHKEYLDRDFVLILNRRIPRNFVEDYAAHIIGRYEGHRILDGKEILGLEFARVEIHFRILKEAGLLDEIGNRNYDHPDYNEFMAELRHWMYEHAPEELKHLPYIQDMKRKRRGAEGA